MLYRMLITAHPQLAYPHPDEHRLAGRWREPVRVRSADPRDTPQINFHYFEDGSDAAGKDLDSVVAGVGFVRSVAEAKELVKQE